METRRTEFTILKMDNNSFFLKHLVYNLFDIIVDIADDTQMYMILSIEPVKKLFKYTIERISGDPLDIKLKKGDIITSIDNKK